MEENKTVLDNTFKNNVHHSIIMGNHLTTDKSYHLLQDYLFGFVLLMILKMTGILQRGCGYLPVYIFL